jgi:DNA-binding response OmpR family regulator
MSEKHFDLRRRSANCSHFSEVYGLFAVAGSSVASRGKVMASVSDIHVLVVDDNRQMRFLLRCLLRAGGVHDVTEADSAEAAFESMRTRPVDLVIVDWLMRPTHGLSFPRAVRWDHASPNPSVPILMLTAHTEPSRVAAARDAGVSGFIKKPISARVLFERVSFVLTDARMIIRSDDFIGPDRRHFQAPDYAGPFRRDADGKVSASLDTIDLDDARWRA